MCKNTNKFSIKQFTEQYSDESKCLDKVFSLTYGKDYKCANCSSI